MLMERNLDERVASFGIEHPDWKLNRKVLKQIKEDILSYYDSEIAYLADEPDDFLAVGVDVDDQGDCVISIMTPYILEEDCQLSAVFEILQHLASFFLCNEEVVLDGEPTPCAVINFKYKNLFNKNTTINVL